MVLCIKGFHWQTEKMSLLVWNFLYRSPWTISSSASKHLLYVLNNAAGYELFSTDWPLWRPKAPADRCLPGQTKSISLKCMFFISAFLWSVWSLTFYGAIQSVNTIVTYYLCYYGKPHVFMLSITTSTASQVGRCSSMLVVAHFVATVWCKPN